VIRYRVRIPAPQTHLVEVEVETAPDPEATRFALPAWSPGSYLIRDYARLVRDFQAWEGGEPGRPLRCHKLDKQTFAVASGPATRRVTFAYRIYAHELTVRTSHVDGRHAFLHGPSLLAYVPSRSAEPVELLLEPPPGWEVVTTLCAAPEGYHADNYDHLADTPIELAPALERLGFEAAGRPHEIAICGRADGPMDSRALGTDVARIVEQAARIFGELPYERYLFLLHLASGVGQGGLEHRDSSALLAAPGSFRPRKKYEELLELFAHEHFHSWNVKRIRPRALGPFDYSAENYTRSLWLMEGVTSYYDRHLLVRAGLLPAKRYLERLGEELARLRQLPGRLVQSLEESSFDAWIKLYKPDEATSNATISYYLKGSLVALALDLEVRHATAGQRSLDDAMRLLWERYGRAPQGFADDAAQSLLEEATGVALGEFFDRHVRGRAELDLEHWLALAGLVVATPEAPEGAAGEGESGWLGVQTRELGSGRMAVTATLTGSPAEAAGLYPGDELVALDGFRLDDKSWRERLGARRVGERVRLALFRRDELLEVEAELSHKPPEAYTVQPDPAAPAAARALYQAWLGEAPPPPPTASP
jgi:predicted metalloprotease with PDZ domain